MSKMFARMGSPPCIIRVAGCPTVQKSAPPGGCYRVSYEPPAGELEGMIALGLESGFGDEWIRIGATSEHTVDGSFSRRTMAMSQTYPGTNDKGNVTTLRQT
jgi:hypothetical protein